jgi:hypothetical protein
MSSQLPPQLRFVRRFENGTLGEMVFSIDPNGWPLPPVYVWKGTLRRLKGERLEWEKSCLAIIAERTGVPTQCAACTQDGEIEVWIFEPGKKAKRIPFNEAAAGALIVYARNFDETGNLISKGGCQ